jgi:DNA-binding HxlR family transcriptional regulator
METFTLSPNVYNAACPTRHVLDLIADKWSALIIGLLESRSLRFAELQRHIGGISQKMLTQTLRNLERDGLVRRTVYAEVPPRVEYALTPLGKTLCEPIAAIIRWSEENIAAVTAAQQGYDERVAGSRKSNIASEEIL